MRRCLERHVSSHQSHSAADDDAAEDGDSDNATESIYL